MTLDTAFMLRHVPDFIHAALVTITIAGAAIAASLIVAMVNSILFYFRVPVFTSMVRAYIELARNTPLLIQLFFLYFALPSIGIRMSSYTTALLAMTFLGGGYVTELFRAGIEAVPKSQLESGLALGLSRWQLFREIVLPQALRISVPSLFANFIFLLKETTVVSAVAVPEILYTTTNYIALYYKTNEMLLMMTILYLLLFFPLSFVLSWLERRFRHGQFGT